LPHTKPPLRTLYQPPLQFFFSSLSASTGVRPPLRMKPIFLPRSNEVSL
jgi:hypothetical protein